MTTCKRCPNPVPFGRRRYCSDQCYKAQRAENQRVRAQRHPDAIRAYQQAWQKANADKQRRYLRAWRMRKAYAAVLK